MTPQSRPENRVAKIPPSVPRPGEREFRAFQKKLFLLRYGNYRSGAEKMCFHDDAETLADLIERRTRQLEHYFNDPDDGDPRASFARAVEELIDCPPLPAVEYGWDPRKP